MVLLINNAIISANSDSIEIYINAALKNNPALNSDFMEYQAWLQKIPQAKSIPDPVMEIGFYLKPMDVDGGGAIADIKLMQMFPWFGVTKAAQTEAVHMANMAYEKFKQTRDDLYFNVYSQWFMIYNLNHKLLALNENKYLLNQLESLLMRKFETAGLLQIQLEKAEVENEIENLISEIKTEKIKFNTLLNRSIDLDVHIPDSIELLKHNSDIAEIINKIVVNNPMLTMIKQEELAYKSKIEMVKKMSFPMIGVGMQYSVLKKDMGTDMFMPMVSLSIPVFRKKYKAQQKEAELLLQSNVEKYSDSFNNLRSELYQIKNQIENSKRQIDLLEKQYNIAISAYNISVQDFSAGKKDLDNVIQLQRQLIDYRFRKEEAKTFYNIQVVAAARLYSFK